MRKSIIEKFDQTIDSPGDKSGYEQLSKDITERLEITAQQQKHSPGLLHKLMHDEDYNRDFSDTCYRYISDNQYDREMFLQHVETLHRNVLNTEQSVEQTLHRLNTEYRYGEQSLVKLRRCSATS